MVEEATASAPKSLLEKALGALADVRGGEGVTALLLTVNILLVLTAYYVIKPVRDALINAMPNGPEYKAYMSAVIAVALLFAVPAYAAYAKRVKRNRLVVGVTLFFASNIVVFYLASYSEFARTWMGLVFYLWVGIFNMMAVAQFWAFAADVYTEEQGKRLFAIVGVGASVGAFAGSLLTDLLAENMGVYQLLLVSAGVLTSAAGLTQVIHLRETRLRNPAYLDEDDDADEAEQEAKPKPTDGGNPFAMVAKHRYLMLLAGFSLVFTLVNSNGEYMLGSLAAEHANALNDAGELPNGVGVGDYLAGFFGNFYLYVNLLGIVLQMFVVSRLVKLGMNVAFLVFPIVALLDASLIAILPILAVVRWGKTAENAVDYSLNNTVRNMLWLPTTREMKYQAKQAVDTFFVRMGDVGNGLVVFVFAGVLSLGVRTIAITNIILVAVWLGLAVMILRERKRMLAQRAADAGTELEPERKPLSANDIAVLTFVVVLIGANGLSLYNEWGLMFWGYFFP